MTDLSNVTDDLGSVHTGSLERPLCVDRVDHGDAQARSWGALPPSALMALDSAGGVAQCWAQPPPPARPQCPRGHTCCPSFRTSLFLTALAPLHPQGPKAGVHLGQAFSVSVPTVCEGPCIPGGPPVASGAGRGPQGCSGTPWFSGWAPCASTPCPAPPWSEGSPSCDLPSALCPFTWTAPEQPSPLEGVGEPPAHQRPWLPHEESTQGSGAPPSSLWRRPGCFLSSSPGRSADASSLERPAPQPEALRPTLPQPPCSAGCSSSVQSG